MHTYVDDTYVQECVACGSERGIKEEREQGSERVRNVGEVEYVGAGCEAGSTGNKDQCIH